MMDRYIPIFLSERRRGFSSSSREEEGRGTILFMVILRLFWRRGSVRIRTTPSFSSVAGVCEGILLGKLRG